MSSPGSLTLTFDAHARRAEKAVAWIALLAAATAPWLFFGAASLSFVYAGCCAAVVALIVALGLYRAGWLGSSQRIVQATWHADGRWSLARSGRPPLDAVLLGDSRVTPNAIWLYWRSSERPWPRLRAMLLITSDLPSGELRRLGVRLRLQGRTSHPFPILPAL